MSKLGNFCVKHHKTVTKVFTGVSAVMIGLLAKNIVDLNRSDAILSRDEQWQEHINQVKDELEKEHPEDNQETGA